VIFRMISHLEPNDSSSGRFGSFAVMATALGQGPARRNQRREFGELVENTIRQVESGYFLPHSGIRFPQNPCTTCPYLGLCLGKQELVENTLVRSRGDDFGWLDELHY
jgi:hypothetical protein